MASYARVLLIAIPFFLVLIGIEALAARRMGIRVNRGADMISSLSSGITNVIKDVLGLTVVIISYSWLVDHLAVVQIRASWLVYVVGFIVLDFAGYWVHRLEHTVNIFWNRHIIHHSSEEFNLSCALRQSIANVTSFIALFMVPAALLGVPAKVIGVIAPLHLFAQFWYHTRLIGTMGPLEAVLVTPSHHRVHHAMNGPYLDRNFGQILILWDKLFGTFQPELPDVPPVYGVKRPVRTWNPVSINLQHVWLLVLDAWRTRSWRDKLRIWFMPTGWRPADVRDRYPVDSVEDFGPFEKYDPRTPVPVLRWAWVQLVFTLALMAGLFLHIGALAFPDILLCGLFLVVGIIGYTTALDGHRSAFWWEAAHLLFGVQLLVRWEFQWMGVYPTITGWCLLGYLVLRLLFLAWARREPTGQPDLAAGT